MMMWERESGKGMGRRRGHPLAVEPLATLQAPCKLLFYFLFFCYTAGAISDFLFLFFIMLQAK